MGLYLTANTAMGGVPVVGWAMDTLCAPTPWPPGALMKDIERPHGAPAARAAEPSAGAWQAFRARAPTAAELS